MIISSHHQVPLKRQSVYRSSTIATWAIVLSAAIMFSPGHANVSPPCNIKNSYVVFASTGKTFAPELTVKSGAAILWLFADGTTSNSPSPKKTFRNASVRHNYLSVTPWSALTGVNLGYDGADGGSEGIKHIPPQGVTGVENMALMAPYLRQWCSSYNHIPSLSFDNFVNLDTIECYRALGLTTVSLRNTPSLRRATFEACHLKTLDVSESPKLEDLRSALNQNSSVKFGSIGEHLRHLCLRDNTQYTQSIPICHFRSLEQIYIWHDNQSGPLNNTRHNLSDVEIDDNQYTSADFTDNANLKNCECYNNKLTSLILARCPELTTLNCSTNRLKNLDISSCRSLTYIDAHHNLLSESAVDNILAALVNAGQTGGTCILAQNSCPSKAGLKSRDMLISRRWDVTLSTAYSDIEWYMLDLWYYYVVDELIGFHRSTYAKSNHQFLLF